MVYYTCERCGYKTHHKSVFRKHLYRKRVCKPIVMDIPIEVLREELEKEFCSLKSAKPSKPPKPLIIYKPHIDKNIEDILDDDTASIDLPSEDDMEYMGSIIDGDAPHGGIYICSFCDTQFTRKYNCTRHQKRCRKRTDNTAKLQKDKIDSLQKKIDNLSKLLEEGGRTNIVGNNNTVIDKQQNNIIINNYKSENMEYITNRVLEKILLMGPVGAVPRLLKYLHFNSKHPENHNLAITDIRSKFAHIRTNNMWQVRILNELLEELVSSKFNILDEYFETEGRTKIPSHKADSYEMYREKLTEDSTLRDQLKNKLYETIVNFSKELDIVKNI